MSTAGGKVIGGVKHLHLKSAKPGAIAKRVWVEQVGWGVCEESMVEFILGDLRRR